MPARLHRRPSASSPNLINEYESSDSSLSPRDTSSAVLGTEPIMLILSSQVYTPIVTVLASPTMDQDVTDNTLYSRAGTINRATGDIEQGQTSPTKVKLAQLQVRETSPNDNNQGDN